MVHTKTSHHDRMEVFLEKYREPLPKPLEELERKAQTPCFVAWEESKLE